MSVVRSTHVLTGHFKSVGYSQVIDKNFDPDNEFLCSTNNTQGYTLPDLKGQTGEVPITHYAGSEPSGQNSFDFMRWSAPGLSGTPEADTLNPLYQVIPENDGDPNEWFYEDVTVNALYNVKEWRIQGTVGTFSFDETVKSGESIVVTQDETLIIQEAPNAATRGVYGFYLSIVGRNPDGDSYVVIFYLFPPQQNSWPERLSGHEESKYSSQPNLDGYIRFNGSTGTSGEIYIGNPKDLGGTVGEPELTETPTVKLLGQRLQCYSDSPPDVNIEITASEWWTTEEWYKG